MAKNKKSRARHIAHPTLEQRRSTFGPLMLGNFKVPEFDGIAAVFGARIKDYPERKSIPTVEHKFKDAFSDLFFRGGKLADHGLKLKSGIDHAAAMTAIRAWMTSFDPQHEHKEETVAWALSEWCEPVANPSAPTLISELTP